LLDGLGTAPSRRCAETPSVEIRAKHKRRFDAFQELSAVEQQRANLAKAKATEVNAALQLARGKELVTKQNIPQATVDQRAADEAAAQANVLAAQAVLDQAEINLGYTEVRSPMSCAALPVAAEIHARPALHRQP
jgi:multidrug efflux pump subunit AcrA (membrane-fusion protein)